MPNNKFDSKSFNAEAFKYMVARVPNLNMNEIKKSRALAANPDIQEVFSGQNGTAYARLAMRGLIDGDAVNYDGSTDITATSTKTFEQGVVVVGRAKAWKERDFSYDVTGGVDFMANISEQVAQYKDELDEATILSILKGIFAMSTTDAKNKEFVEKHTTTVSGAMTATTLNTAANKACGANKKKFTLVFCHSDVSTGLENLNLIERLKYTDKDGIQRDLELGTWNGKLVIVTDQMPVSEGYFDADANTTGALKIVASGMLEGVEVKLGVDYDTNRDAFRDAAPTVLYTGQIDAYFGYRLGNLEYRGLRFETERLEKENYQGVACMNFTAREVPYTRIIEHKHFEFGTQPVTYITREYPSDWKPGDEAYYPVNNEANQKLYKAYQKLAATEKNVIFGGRLGEYKYYDMDKVIESALNMCERVFG